MLVTYRGKMKYGVRVTAYIRTTASRYGTHEEPSDRAMLHVPYSDCAKSEVVNNAAYPWAIGREIHDIVNSRKFHAAPTIIGMYGVYELSW